MIAVGKIEHPPDHVLRFVALAAVADTCVDESGDSLVSHLIGECQCLEFLL